MTLGVVGASALLREWERGMKDLRRKVHELGTYRALGSMQAWQGHLLDGHRVAVGSGGS